MIESKVSKLPVGKLDYFLKEEDENKEKKKQGDKEGSGTNFNEYGYKLILKLQYLFLCFSLILIPITLFPLEWMMFEYGRVFILIFFTIILLTFELIKFFVRGKVEIYKSPRDVILLLLAASFIISLLFSSDSLVSFWGYEYRFGTGFISIITIFVYLLILKSMVKDSKGLVNLIFCLTVGIFISAILSVFSFYSINPFGFLPEFEKFFFVGLPFFGSAKLSIGIWSLGMLLSFFIFYYFFKKLSNNEVYLDKKSFLFNSYRKKRAIQICFFLFFISVISVFIFAISLFSIINASWLGAISLVSVFVICLFLTFLSASRILKFATISVLALSFIIFGVFRLPYVQNVLSIDSENLVEQVALENEAIWNITVSSLSESFARALVGLGNDNFVVAYNLYRPAFSGDIDLNFVNYSYANNEIYNIVANRGLVGLFIWLVVGFLIFKQFIQYLINESRKQIVKLDSLENIAIILLDLLLIYIWIFAFFAYYSFILYFIFFLLLVLSSLFKNIVYKMYTESLVIQTNFFVERIGQVKSDTLPKFFILLVCVGSVFTLYFMLNDFISRVYVVKAESIAYDLDNANKEKELSSAEQEQKLQEIIQNYDDAILRNPNNYVFRRRVSLVLMQYINKVLAKDYSTLTDENEKQEYIRVVGVYSEAALEEAKKATDLAPMISVNWGNRDFIYADLVRMGFHNYINTAIKVSEQSIMRNPNNYNPYVNQATYLYLSGDSGGAISYIRQALEINPYNISALVLAGEVSMGLQDYANARSYFEDSKILLEELDFTQMEVFNLYEQVQKNLELIWSLEVAVEEDLTLPDEEISD